MARPEIYSQETADEICRRVADGETLLKICKDEHMPSRPTVYAWLQDDDKQAFFNNYTRALTLRADSRVDKLDEVGDEMRTGKIDAGEAKVLSDNIKWTAARENPKKYGDRILNEHAGKVSVVEVQTFVDDPSKPEEAP